MNEKLDEALARDFPKLYADRFGNIRTSCMPWGFECRSGWEPLIRRLSEKLEGHTVAVQVKEKFGGLRFYVTTATDEIYNIIDAAEAESFTICEKCGKPGAVRDGGWIETLCENCFKE